MALEHEPLLTSKSDDVEVYRALVHTPDVGVCAPVSNRLLAYLKRTSYAKRIKQQASRQNRGGTRASHPPSTRDY